MKHGRATGPSRPDEPDNAGGPVGAVRLASLAAVSITAGLAGCAFHRGFAASGLLPAIAVAAVLPVIVSAALTRPVRRPDSPPRLPPLPLSVCLSLLVWLAVVWVTLFRNGSPYAPGTLPAVWDGVVNGGTRLLDTTLPVQGSPDLLVVPQALTWLAALAGAEIAARTRALLVPALPAVAVFAAGVLLTVPGVGSNLGVAAGLVVAVMLLVGCRRAELTGSELAVGGRGGRDRGAGQAWPAAALGRVVPAALMLTVTVGAATLAGPLLAAAGPGAEPYDVRRLRQVRLDQRTAQNPLDFVSAWLGRPDEVLFRVSPPPSGNLRLAVLDRFDGQQWTSSARYLPAGGRVPPATGTASAKPAGNAPAESSHFQIVALDGPFLPHRDRPVALSGAELAVDLRDGTLTAREGGPALADRGYTVESVAPREPTPAELASARVPAGTDGDGTPGLPPGVPEVVAAAARVATDGALTPFQQAHQLEQYLRGLTYDPSAPAGHTYGHLAYFLGTSRTGTSEQFAASYAVLARLVGLPNRVVIGFSPKPVAAGDDARPGDAPNGAAHAGEVRTGDVLVWPEIHFEGLGWVPFYPTPAAAKDDSGQVATSAQGEPSERAQRVAEAAAVPAPTPTAAPAPPAAPAGGSGTLLLAALGAAALCAVGTSGYLVTAWAVPRLRRRRRRSRVSDARERVVGAWLDTLDALDVAGIPVPASATSAEIVTAVAAGSPVAADPASSAADPVSSAADPAPAGSPAAGGSSLTGLAALATVALFAGGEVSAADADTAWRQADQVRARLRRTTPRVRRIRRSLAPDRLRPRRRPTAAEPRRPRKAVRMSRGTGR